MAVFPCVDQPRIGVVNILHVKKGTSKKTLPYGWLGQSEVNGFQVHPDILGADSADLQSIVTEAGLGESGQCTPDIGQGEKDL